MLERGRTQPWVSVTCGDCGTDFPLSTRNAFRARNEGREPRCAMCRRPPRPLSDEERRRFSAWWADRLGGMEQAVELAGLIWR